MKFNHVSFSFFLSQQIIPGLRWDASLVKLLVKEKVATGSGGKGCKQARSQTHLDDVAALLLRNSDEAGQVGLVVSARRGAGRSLVVVREMNPTCPGGGAW